MPVEKIAGLGLVETGQLIAPVMDERKAIAFAVIEPGAGYTADEIHERLELLQHGDTVWSVGSRLLQSYCDSFEECEIVRRNGAGDYRPTSKGANYIRPAIGHLLEFSLVEAPSLSTVGGAMNTTSNTGSRPIEKRIRIFNILNRLNGNKVKVSDMATELGTKESGVGVIVDNLAAAELITKVASEKGKPVLTYTASPKLANYAIQPHNSSQLHIDIVELLQTHFAQQPDTALDSMDITMMLREFRMSDMPQEELYRKVANITYALAYYRKVLEAHKEVEGRTARTLAWLTPEQQRTIQEFLAVVDGMQNPTPEFLQHGKNLINKILGDPESVEYLYTKAKQNSSGHLRGKEQQELIKATLTDIIVNASTPLSTREIWGTLIAEGYIVSYKMVYNHMKKFTAAGTTDCVQTKSGLKFFPAKIAAYTAQSSLSRS